MVHNLIIIIIMAGMAVFNVAGYLIEERRGWPVITVHCNLIVHNIFTRNITIVMMWQHVVFKTTSTECNLLNLVS